MNTLIRKQKDLLLVFNIFGQKKNEDAQIFEYCNTLDSIFWHIDQNKLQRNIRVVVSACLVSDRMVRALEEKYDGRLDIVRYSAPSKPIEDAPAWANVGRWSCQITFNKTCIYCEEQFEEDYNGYFFIGSGLLLPEIKDLFPRIIEKNNSGDYGIIQLQVDHDGGYHWLGHGRSWQQKIDFNEDYHIPIGNNCNWHIGVFNRSLREYYGVPESDIHGVCGLESALSYTSYALRKKYVLLGNSKCHHVPRSDHYEQMIDAIQNMPKIECGRLWGRTNQHFLDDLSGERSGLGYFPGEQCNNEVDFFGVVMPHRPDKYDSDYLSNDPKCKEAVKRQYFTNKDELDYENVECSLIRTTKDDSQFAWSLINDNISRSDKKVMAEFILKSNRFTNGPKVKKFEDAWSEWLGVEHTTFVNSGASANYIMMSIVKELRGLGEVIVPPIGWVSDIAPVVNLGFKPVFVDVEKNNLSMSFKKIKAAVTKDTKAIVLVHALGFNAIEEGLVEFAKEKNILLIEDCCESHGATFNGKKIGSIGDMSNFSFYYGHHITTIEGGVVCTNNPEIYEYSKLFRSHGMTREASEELQEKYVSDYPDLNPLFTFAVPGYNMRGTELNAVLGLEQINRLDSNIQKRSENLNYWLNNLDKEKFFVEYAVEGNSSFALPLILRKKSKKLLNKVCEVLKDSAVEYRLGTAGGGNQARQPYLEKYEHKVKGKLSVSNHIHDYGLYIGNHTEVTKEQIIELCKRLNNV